MPRRPCGILVRGLGLVLAGCRATGHEPPAAEPESDLSGLAWLAGSWILVGGSAVSQEHWTRPRGRTMLGLNRTVIDGRAIVWTPALKAGKTADRSRNNGRGADRPSTPRPEDAET
jgi:hypothetical protein